MISELDDQHEKESNAISDRLHQATEFLTNIQSNIGEGTSLVRTSFDPVGTPSDTDLVESPSDTELVGTPSDTDRGAFYEDVISRLSTFTDENLSTLNYNPCEVFLEIDEEPILEQFQTLNVVFHKNDAGN